MPSRKDNPRKDIVVLLRLPGATLALHRPSQQWFLHIPAIWNNEPDSESMIDHQMVNQLIRDGRIVPSGKLDQYVWRHK